MPELVTLTWVELVLAGFVGLAREARAEGARRDPRFAYENARERWGAHPLGAAAELAFAKWAGLYWPASVDTFKAADVAGYEVRATLKVVDRDPDERVVVFVSPPKYAGSESAFAFEMVGWITAGEAKRTVPLSDPGKRGALAHFLKRTHLRPMSEMPKQGVTA